MKSCGNKTSPKGGTFLKVAFVIAATRPLATTRGLRGAGQESKIVETWRRVADGESSFNNGREL